MPQGFDPDVLLRQSWKGDPDGFARELHLLLRQLTPLLSPGRAAPVSPARPGRQPAVPSLATNPGSTPVVSGLVSRLLRPPAEAPAPSRPSLATNPGSTPVVSGLASIPPRPPTSEAPSPAAPRAIVPEIPAAIGLAISSNTPDERPRPLAPRPATPIASHGRLVSPSVTIMATPDYSPSDNVSAGRPGPSPSIPIRAGLSPPPSATSVAAIDFGPATPAFQWFEAPRVLAQARIERGDLLSAGNPVSGQDIVETVRTMPADAPRHPVARERREMGVGAVSSYGDYDFDSRTLALTASAGVTPMSLGGGGGTIGKPGNGQATILQFDGTSLTMLSTDTVGVFNLSLLPIGGNEMRLIERYGDYFWFNHRPTLGHAIITTQITACNGTTPGTGFVQLYYMSGGKMTSVGSPVPCSNWYSVTGPAGKHCGVMESDGGLCLEVLDC